MTEIKKLIENIKNVQYIKLGKGGSEFDDCYATKRIFLNYWTGIPDVFDAGQNKEWERLKVCHDAAIDNDSKQTNKSDGFKTRSFHCNKRFFDGDDGTLWITFHNRCLYWCFMKPGSFEANGAAAYAQTLNGWQNLDFNKEKKLSMNQLAGFLTKTAATTNTICNVDERAIGYLRNKLLGKENPKVGAYRKAQNDVSIQNPNNTELIKAISDLIRDLTPSHFEVLVDLIFSHNGWQKEQPMGGSQSLIDLDVYHPGSKKRAFVQIKSASTFDQFRSNYLPQFVEDTGFWDEMYWVQHSGQVDTFAENLNQLKEDILITNIGMASYSGKKEINLTLTPKLRARLESIHIWNCTKISELVLEADLGEWLIRRLK